VAHLFQPALQDDMASTTRRPPPATSP